MKKSILNVSSGALASLVAAGGPALSAEEAPRPNIIVIVADDLGWNAVGYRNPEVRTPNIDERIRGEGLELNAFYVTPMCSPTRAGLMTGRHPIRFGRARAVVRPWVDAGMPLDEVMLSEALAQAGYEHRGVFGKWHLGHLRRQWQPLQRGFTEFRGGFNGALDFFELSRNGERDWHHNNDPCEDTGYATTLTGRYAAEFIRNAAQSDSPFFCYVPFHAPHTPFQAPGRYQEMYEHIEDRAHRVYFAMITAMDDAIGRILDTVDELGIADNTVVWFFSDNGGIRRIPRNNYPLREYKLTSYDGGVRVVACVRYPSRYPSGVKINERTAYIDVMPTVLALAGITPEAAGCKPMDGLDLNPLFSGQTDQLPERDLFFYHGQPGYHREFASLISGEWKLVANGPDLRVAGVTSDHVFELFRLSEDERESENLADAHPEIATAMFDRLMEHRRLQPANPIPAENEHLNRDTFVPPPNWHVTE